MTRTSVLKTYKRKGYIVTHHEQRTRHAHCHHFIIHDLGALYLPKARHLARLFIPLKAPNGFIRRIIAVKSGTSGIKSMWYQLDIQYQTVKKEKK